MLHLDSISAAIYRHAPSVPALPRLDAFEGRVMVFDLLGRTALSRIGKGRAEVRKTRSGIRFDRFIARSFLTDYK
jgi:hypothetical protein